ncbi:MAG: hypothetical protein WCG61_05245 [Chlorobium sp.]
MKNSFLKLIAVGSIALATGCSSSSSSTVAPPQAKQIDLNELPNWMSKPPTSDLENKYAIGTGTSQDLQFAIEKAMLNARSGIADQLKADLAKETNTVLNEGGKNTSAVLDRFDKLRLEQYSKASLTGSSVVEQKILREGALFRVYALVKYPVGQVNAELLNKAKNMDYDSSKQNAEKEIKELRQRQQ